MIEDHKEPLFMHVIFTDIYRIRNYNWVIFKAFFFIHLKITIKSSFHVNIIIFMKVNYVFQSKYNLE